MGEVERFALLLRSYGSCLTCDVGVHPGQARSADLEAGNGHEPDGYGEPEGGDTTDERRCQPGGGIDAGYPEQQHHHGLGAAETTWQKRNRTCQYADGINADRDKQRRAGIEMLQDNPKAHALRTPCE